MKRVGIFVLVFLFAGVSYGQEQLTNPGFEMGNYTGWTTCGAQGLDSDQFLPVPHSGSFATQVPGCCGQHDAGGGYQEVSTDPGASYIVGGWVRTCSYGGTSITSTGHGGTTCSSPTMVIGSTPEPPDCVYYQFTTTVSGQSSISVHYAWPETEWGASANAADDLTVFQLAVDGWMFY